MTSVHDKRLGECFTGRLSSIRMQSRTYILLQLAMTARCQTWSGKHGQLKRTDIIAESRIEDDRCHVAVAVHLTALLGGPKLVHFDQLDTVA